MKIENGLARFEADEAERKRDKIRMVIFAAAMGLALIVGKALGL